MDGRVAGRASRGRPKARWTDNIRALNGGRLNVWPEEDRTGQGRMEGVHFSDHRGTADALID